MQKSENYNKKSQVYKQGDKVLLKTLGSQNSIKLPT